MAYDAVGIYLDDQIHDVSMPIPPDYTPSIILAVLVIGLLVSTVYFLFKLK